MELLAGARITWQEVVEAVRGAIGDIATTALVRELTPEEWETVIARAEQVVQDIERRHMVMAGQRPFPSVREAARSAVDDIIGMGPLQPLMDDPEIEEVMINSPQRVFVIREGRKYRTDIRFASDDEVLRLVRRLLARVGRRLDESNPMVDCRLPDGSRLNAVIPPITHRYSAVTIRKHVTRAQTLQDLVELGTMEPAVARFLEACVRARLCILVSGGTGAGKTTLLNALARAIPPVERIVTIEETLELKLVDFLPDCVPTEARPPNLEGEGEITIRALVRNALRMRPTRIIVGEVRGPEAFDMLQAMNSGHEGSMCTLHANSPRQAIVKLVSYACMAQEGLSERAITRMVADLQPIILQMRFLGNYQTGVARRVLDAVVEVAGYEQEADVVATTDIFVRTPRGLEYTGIRPRCARRLEEAGYSFSELTASLTGGAVA